MLSNHLEEIIQNTFVTTSSRSQFKMLQKMLQKMSQMHNSILICDMIKRNESDVGNSDFDILAKSVFKFLYFILFIALINSS